MTTTLPSSQTKPGPARGAVDVPERPGRAEGVELLGPVKGSGYRAGTGLVRRADGQMVQLGPLMYAVLEAADGSHSAPQLADEVSEKLQRQLTADQAQQLAAKLAAQGLLAGTEHAAPPRRNPLLALRWKFLLTNPKITRRITAPFAGLFHSWIMWPALAAFVGVFWYVLFEKGLAAATAKAFNNPGMLLTVFALGVISAGIHEFGHAAACRYGGATPGGMGAGLYLVWPAFYTDVTDAYRLDRRSRLRVDLGGLYFNAVISVVTFGVWLAVRNDALLLLIGLQLLQMVKQLSPVIRADGYHILADATGVPDLFAHLGPTLRRLIPGHRHEPSALTGRARALVTLWVLIIVPVLLSLMVGAVLVLPRVATSAWDSGRHIVDDIPHQSTTGVLASLLRLLALLLPVLGSSYITVRLATMAVRRGRAWSRGRPGRKIVAVIAAAAVVAGLVWAWWPSGQYQPVRPSERGTIGSLVADLSAPSAAVRPTVVPSDVQLSPGRHLALVMVPVGGPTAVHPVLIVLPGQGSSPPVAVLTGAPSGAPTPTAGTGFPLQLPTQVAPSSAPSSGGVSSGPSSGGSLPFTLPSAPGPGDSQALAVNTTNHGVVYNVDYGIVTISNGAPVTNTNSAYALANCTACTTVAVSFQVVLVIGQSNQIAPIDKAEALNDNCLACMTTAMADQLVLTLNAQPSQHLMHELMATLRTLNVLPLLGAAGTPQAIEAVVQKVQDQVVSELAASGLLVTPSPTASSQALATASPGATSSAAAQVTSSPSPSGGSAAGPSPTATTSATQATPSPSATSATATASSSP